jgi:hypothetical protein
MDDLISIRECGRRLGVSESSVRKAILAQRIKIAKRVGKGNRPLLDWAEASVDWENNGCLMKTAKKDSPIIESKKPIIIENNTSAFKLYDSDDVIELPPNPTINQSRQYKEAYRARMARLDYEEKSGKLIDVEKVKAQAFNTGRSIRDALLNIPDRVASELAAETDAARVHALLTADIREALNALAETAA